MGWGFMMGLGQGLTQAGGMIQDNYKQKLAAQLEKDKEDRANKRADLVYNRDQMSFDHEMWAPDPASAGDPGGEVMRIYKVNKAGDRYGEGRLPSQDELEDRNRAEQSANISLQNAVLGNKKTQLEIENMPQEQADKHAVSQATAGYYSDRGTAAVTNASRPRSGNGGSPLDPTASPDTTPDQEAQVLMDTYKDLIKSYTSPGKDADGNPVPPKMSLAQATKLAQSVIRTSSLDPSHRAQLGKIFVSALSRQAADTKYANSL